MHIGRDHPCRHPRPGRPDQYIGTQIAALVTASATTLNRLYGIGPVIAGRILAEVGDVARFPAKDAFASYNGTAPIDVSSGDQVRHRLPTRGSELPAVDVLREVKPDARVAEEAEHKSPYRWATVQTARPSATERSHTQHSRLPHRLYSAGQASRSDAERAEHERTPAACSWPGWPPAPRCQVPGCRRARTGRGMTGRQRARAGTQQAGADHRRRQPGHDSCPPVAPGGRPAEPPRGASVSPRHLRRSGRPRRPTAQGEHEARRRGAVPRSRRWRRAPGRTPA